MKDLSWDDLQIFLHVAETGGLSAAARATGLSAPTIGRRMLALEQQTGQQLFVRAQTGYTLTATGAALHQRVRAMRAAAQPVQALLSPATETPWIRLSAGTATANFIADNHARLIRPGDDFRLNFVTSEAVLDVAHREIDLGIRNRPAETGNVATLRLGRLAHAPYRSQGAGPDLTSWVAMDPAHARHPAAHWVHRQNLSIRAFAGTVATVQDLVRAGVGIGVIPCLVGDRDPSLTRAGPLIDELEEVQYLVMHADDRHRPPIRRLIDRIRHLYRDNADLLAGLRPLRGAAKDD
ncbi:DNA-binding transcriptional regulator IlvY [Marinibacterium anthonyi]|nr:DNA-binding transcriptional regulator IlvY [Marinibacterium anthonyi]